MIESGTSQGKKTLDGIYNKFKSLKLLRWVNIAKDKFRIQGHNLNIKRKRKIKNCFYKNQNLIPIVSTNLDLVMKKLSIFTNDDGI